MLLRSEVLVLFAQRAEVVSVVAQHATVAFNKVVGARHEDSRPRRRRPEALPGVLEGRRHGGEVSPDVEGFRNERRTPARVHAH